MHSSITTVVFWDISMECNRSYWWGCECRCEIVRRNFKYISFMCCKASNFYQCKYKYITASPVILPFRFLSTETPSLIWDPWRLRSTKFLSLWLSELLVLGVKVICSAFEFHDPLQGSRWWFSDIFPSITKCSKAFNLVFRSSFSEVSWVTTSYMSSIFSPVSQSFLPNCFRYI